MTKKKQYYKNRRGEWFCEGTIVRLDSSAMVTNDPRPVTFAGKPISMSRISSLLINESGLVCLEYKLGGYYTWNVNELQKVK